jgi:hypothetical protein
VRTLDFQGRLHIPEAPKIGTDYILSRAVVLGGLFSALSAIVYVGFGAYFSRAFGIAAYGQFGLVANTFSAVLIATALAGFFLRHGLTSSRAAFDAAHRVLAAPLIFIAFVLACILSFSTGGDLLTVGLGFVIFFAFLFRNLPYAVLLSGEANWVPAALNFIQVVLSLSGFWLLVACGLSTFQAYSLALSVAAIASWVAAFPYVARLLREQVDSEPGVALRLSDLTSAIVAGSAAAVMVLSDKVFISRNLGSINAAELGVYFICFDLVTKAAFVYRTFLSPLTSAIVQEDRAGNSVLRYVVLALVLNVGVTTAVCAALFLVVPRLYGFYSVHADYKWIMIEMTCFSALNGIGYAVIALCNGLGINHLLVRQNVTSSILIVATLACSHWLRVVSCVWLGFVICLGQMPQLITFSRVVREVFLRRGRAVARSMTAT